MHKDQDRVRKALLPYLLKRTEETSPEAERDCTLLNRMLLQGPDPLFLMESCPREFNVLCQIFGFSVPEGREIIEQAHWRGPAILLGHNEDGTRGLQPSQWGEQPINLSLAQRGEAVWLFLAHCSHCREEEYPEAASLLYRTRRMTGSVIQFASLICQDENVWTKVFGTLNKYLRTPYTTDSTYNIPLFTVDEGFYVGYKLGHPAVAVQADGVRFYGTIPTTTLAEQGITVDKQISTQFGLVFDKPTDPVSS